MGRRTGSTSRAGATLALALGVAHAGAGCGKSQTGDDKASAAGRAGKAGDTASGGRSGALGQGGGGRAGASSTSAGQAGAAGAMLGRGGAGTAGGEGGEGGEGGSETISSGGSAITITGGSAGQACNGTTATLKGSPLALYLMLDVSGSMLDPLGSSTSTKWQAMKSGVLAFLDESPDLDIALGYFPHRLTGVPDTCTTDVECGPGAPCLTHVCQQTPGTLVACVPASDPVDLAPCNDAIVRDDGPCREGVCWLAAKACNGDEDCRVRAAALGTCLELGVCEADPALTCSDTDPAKNHPGCGPNGTAGKCLPSAASFCLHETDCEPQHYEEPALDFPAAPSAVEGSLAAQEPRGDSPARAALHGAIAHARAFHAENGRDVAVVLATDGLPTDCSTARAYGAESSAAVDDLVAEAAEGLTPALAPSAASVRTFVLGVLGDSDISALDGLDRVAEAGGTDQAYVLPADADAEARLIAALQAIRDSTLGCRLELPAGMTVDAALVNVVLESGNGSSESLELVTPEACSSATKQWHFDTDPTSGEPTAIELCPATCDALKSSPEAQLSVMFACRPLMR